VRKPDLPDPQHGRYWDIEVDDDSDLLVKLKSSNGELLREKYIYSPLGEDPVATVEKFVTGMLEEFNSVTYIAGQYKFNGEK